jgi:hypothetical protein
MSSPGRRRGRLRSFPLAARRFNSHPSPLLTPLARRLWLSSRGRRAVVAAGDYVRFRSLRFASTHIHRPYSRHPLNRRPPDLSTTLLLSFAFFTNKSAFPPHTKIEQFQNYSCYIFTIARKTN